MLRNKKRRRRYLGSVLLPVTVLAATASVSIAASGGAATGDDRDARISVSDPTVLYGEQFVVGGRLATEKGTWVSLLFRAAGADGWRRVGQIHSDSRGHYQTTLRGRVNGAYRAVPASGEATGSESIRVRSRAALHVAKHHTMVGKGLALTGRALPGGRRTVKVVVNGPDGSEVTEATNSRGVFSLRWKPQRTGRYTLRAFVGRNRLAKGSRSLTRRVTVYRYAEASWYGPGLYGNQTACGQILTPETTGVANAQLPCGTKVTLRYHGRAMTVPVIDTGVFVPGREYDLTYATRERLGFPDVDLLMTTH